MTRGVILYGPPASGKDTITTALSQLDPAYQLFRRLKVGPGRQTGYRMTTTAHIDRLRAAGQIVWENSRYSATYVVDREGLNHALHDGTPIVHLGQSAARAAICAATPQTAWLVVSLWCPREVAAERLAARGAADIPDRLAAWDATENLRTPDLMIDTSEVTATNAAQIIHSRRQRHSLATLEPPC